MRELQGVHVYNNIIINTTMGPRPKQQTKGHVDNTKQQ